MISETRVSRSHESCGGDILNAGSANEWQIDNQRWNDYYYGGWSGSIYRRIQCIEAPQTIAKAARTVRMGCHSQSPILTTSRQSQFVQ